MQNILKSYEQSEQASKVEREQLYAAKTEQLLLREQLSAVGHALKKSEKELEKARKDLSRLREERSAL